MTGQAVALNAIFASMARRAAMNASEYLDATDRYMRRGEAHGESEFSIPTNGGESADNLRRFNSLGLTPFRHPLRCKTVR